MHRGRTGINYGFSYRRDDERGEYSRRGDVTVRSAGNFTDRCIKQPKRKYFGFKHLEELSDKEPSDIAFVIFNRSNGFVDLFKQNKDPDWLFLLMKVTAKVCEAEFFESKRYILSEICRCSTFINHLQSYVLASPQETNENRRENMMIFFDNCLTACRSMEELFLKTAAERLNNLVMGIKLAVSLIKIGYSDVEVNDAELTGKITGLLERFAELKSNGRTKKNELLNITPSENFRTLFLYPTPNDLDSGEPFLRPNITEGAYESVEHYLDVQFRLLREDFVAPLREGIRCYKDNKNKHGEGRKKINNIRVYENVTFGERIEFVKDKLGYLVSFNTNKRLKINWEVSKRFMNGSLLLFTDDGFDNFFIGVVLARDRHYLENGQLIIELIDDKQPTSSVSFTMAESEVYFEPYKCAMQVLKSMNNDNFPMAKYIIDANNTIDIPRYLKQARNYYFDNTAKFNVLNDCEWPSHDKFGLDEMQYKAFRAALTNEFTVIQGPPGTGKTLLGWKIVKTIIQTFYTSHDTRGTMLRNPVIVVCYTNHALDQFLEGILAFTENIVRIGGQTKSSLIEKFTLQNVTKDYRKSFNVFSSIKTKYMEVKETMHEITYLKKCKEYISENAGILELSLLKNGMPEEYHSFFNDPIKYIHWLFYDSTYFDFNPVTFIENQEFVNQVFHSEKLLEVKTWNETEDETETYLPYETEDSDTNFKHEDIVVYSFTLSGIYNYIEEIKSYVFGKKKNKISNKKYFTYNYYNIMKQIHDYFGVKLTLANNDTELPTIPKNLFELTMKDRWLLYFHWVNFTQYMFDEKIQRHEKHYINLHKQYLELKEMENIAILSKKHVVAMTTTGAAKHRVLLEGLQSPIVIVEEAAEVFEAHIIASLTRHCQHLILIGDHKQLRPQNAVYKLAKDFHFDISLFERMVNSGVPYYTLREQHRMRPEVSCLITPSIYPVLLNHSSVIDRPHIRGVVKDVFFLDHKHFETQVEEISSKSNDHEASFLIMFARYLILQSYKPNQVTIITTYRGQMFKLRSLQKNYSELNDMKIQVVDNYQGEESDIILLSLVRSNETGAVGFLKTENRICVALSRAKSGLYVMGNMENLYNSGDLWKKIKQKLVDQDSFGTELILECTVHQGELAKVSKSEDFEPISEGGCTKPCIALMNCGHYCTKICHSYDREHELFKCQYSCNRSCKHNHPCEKKCFESCGDCIVSMPKILPCDHQILLPCHLDPEKYKCMEKVEVLLDKCGHKIIKKCHDKNPSCTVKCEDRLDCGHACESNCHKNDDPEHEIYKCLKPCAKTNTSCSKNHKCLKKCYEECSLCVIKVDKKLECGHIKTNVPCSNNINDIQCSPHIPCNRKLKCGHQCRKKCTEQCVCTEYINKVLPECGHEIKFECKLNPDEVICNKKCTKTLSCGHKCKNICGIECDSDQNKCKILVLKENLKLACGHRKMWIFCCDMNKELDIYSEDVLKKCEEPCLKKLCCGDICSGTCGKCKQGRLHIQCEQKCNKINPCNHTCTYPCKEMCPPCMVKCSNSCSHSKCPRLCSDPCTPCQERCVWRCRHFTCTNACGEYCNRPPCYKPCPLKLKCNHKCIGFCGEPCPPLCRLCDKDEVTTILFGHEDEPDARFVYLSDCKHTVESKSLEQWINQNKEEVSMIQCPLCKVPVLRTLRFNKQTKMAYADMADIKFKLMARSSGTEETRGKLLDSIRSLDKRLVSYPKKSGVHFKTTQQRWNDVVKSMRNVLRKNIKRNPRQPVLVSANEIDSLKFVVRLTRNIFRYLKRVENISDAMLKNAAAEHFAWLREIAFLRPNRLTEQQKMDIGLETVRGGRLVGLYETQTNAAHVLLQKSPAAVEAQGLIDGMRSLLTSHERYDRAKDAEVQRLADRMTALTAISSKTTDEERKMIHSAMTPSFRGGSRAQGHWLKCANGHIYCVTECGGPMQESNCPECGVSIGGMNHGYAAGTRVATEMDGARHVAWSSANNMNNYLL